MPISFAQLGEVAPASTPTRAGLAGARTCSATRVLLITNIPTPYRIPLFNELNQQFAREGIAFKVIFAALGYPRRKWAIDMTQCAFPWAVLNSRRVPSRDPESAVFMYSGLGRVLREEKDALIIVSGFSMATTRIWLRSFLRKTPYLIWSGAIERKDRHDSMIQRWQRRLLVSRAQGWIAYGTRAKEYLVSLGADPFRVSVGINTVDSDYFRGEVARLRTESNGGPKRILYVGNLEPGKRVDHLLRIVSVLAESRDDFVLHIVGSGSQEQRLKALSQELGLGDRVRFFGFVQRPEVARHLATAFCFAFPSEYDIWGLVLVEAMAAGVPCVSSIYAGATRDLIHNGYTGFAVDFSDSRRVAEILAGLLDDPEGARKMADRAASFVAEKLALSNSAEGFVDAVRRSPVCN